MSPQEPSNLRAIRLQQGKTQLQLAAAANTTIRTVSNWEQAETVEEAENIQLPTLRQLAKALGVSPAEILPSLNQKDV